MVAHPPKNSDRAPAENRSSAPAVSSAQSQPQMDREAGPQSDLPPETHAPKFNPRDPRAIQAILNLFTDPKLSLRDVADQAVVEGQSRSRSSRPRIGPVGVARCAASRHAASASLSLLKRARGKRLLHPITSKIHNFVDSSRHALRIAGATSTADSTCSSRRSHSARQAPNFACGF